MADTKILIGILGVLLITGAGTLLVLDKAQMDKTYVCTTNNVTGIFNNISVTAKTAYWSENGTLKSSVCRNGVWIKIDKWCSDNKLDCKVLYPDGIKVNETLPPEKYDENGYEYVYSKDIIIKESKTINFNGTIINITYQPVIKCICDKVTGCKIVECLNATKI